MYTRTSPTIQNAAARMLLLMCGHNRRVLRGRYIHRHKGRPLRRHAFYALFDDVGPYDLERATDAVLREYQELEGREMARQARPIHPFTTQRPGVFTVPRIERPMAIINTEVPA